MSGLFLLESLAVGHICLTIVKLMSSASPVITILEISIDKGGMFVTPVHIQV